MVFPTGKALRVYGTGEGLVTVTLADAVGTAMAQNGAFCVELPPLSYGGPYELTATDDVGTQVLTDVYVGEVYLCAGQSNMQFKVQEAAIPPETYCDNPRLRLFSTDRLESSDRYVAQDGWVPCERENAADWSALAYLIGNEITARRDVAVGVVACYQGASVIESWVPKGTFEKIGIRIPIEEKSLDHTYGPYALWRGDGALYEFAFSQVIPFAFSGVVWYQGESDDSPAEGRVYAAELTELIRVWRADLRDESLPFVVVQIADCDERAGEGWKMVQAAQMQVGETVPYVTTVVSADVCETDDIHPKTKDKLARRIADAL